MTQQVSTFGELLTNLNQLPERLDSFRQRSDQLQTPRDQSGAAAAAVGTMAETSEITNTVSTPNTANTAAVVFSTYELLEAILRYLSPKEITRAMRVARNWRNMVSKSKTLHDLRILCPYQGELPALHAGRGRLPLYDREYGIRFFHQTPLGGSTSVYKGTYELEIGGEEEIDTALGIQEGCEEYLTTPPMSGGSRTL